MLEFTPYSKVGFLTAGFVVASFNLLKLASFAVACVWSGLLTTEIRYKQLVYNSIFKLVGWDGGFVYTSVVHTCPVNAHICYSGTHVYVLQLHHSVKWEYSQCVGHH